jgi:hypothetical protein
MAHRNRFTTAMLGHVSFASTEKYYVMSQSRLAGRALVRAINGLKQRLE